MKKSLQKWILIALAFTFFFAVSVPDQADARRGGGGGFKSGTRSFTNTPKKTTPTDNVNKTTSNTNTSKAGTTANRGFFSGGSFMKGLMIGGLAGMLFGGLFGGMGFMGDFLGLVVNLLAIYVLFALIRAGYRAFKNRRKPEPRDGRY